MRSILLVVLSMFVCCAAYAAQGTSTNLNWYTNYEQAVNESRASSKPMILFFTGSDWCGWCHKLEDEVLNTHEFAEAAKDKFVFVKLDFPMHSQSDATTLAQNKQLQKKFEVKGFPTLVILDDQQQQIGVTGYRPGGPNAYADHLLKIVNDYLGYHKKMSALEQRKSSSEELEHLYCKAQELCRYDEANKIVKIGMDQKDNLFFLQERYRFLADEGQIHEPEAQALKTKILSLDPNNENKSHYNLAVIDFEAYSEEMAKENYSPDLAVAPLVAYIEKFGSKDPQNLWRLQMIISQLYLDKNDLSDALKYAKAAQESAPSNVKPDIETAIANIQIHLR